MCSRILSSTGSFSSRRRHKPPPWGATNVTLCARSRAARRGSASRPDTRNQNTKTSLPVKTPKPGRLRNSPIQVTPEQMAQDFAVRRARDTPSGGKQVGWALPPSSSAAMQISARCEKGFSHQRIDGRHALPRGRHPLPYGRGSDLHRGSDLRRSPRRRIRPAARRGRGWCW